MGRVFETFLAGFFLLGSPHLDLAPPWGLLMCILWFGRGLNSGSSSLAIVINMHSGASFLELIFSGNAADASEGVNSVDWMASVSDVSVLEWTSVDCSFSAFSGRASGITVVDLLAWLTSFSS